MKRIITTIAMIIMMSLGSIMAQGYDGFFEYEDNDSRWIEDPTAPILPGMHGQVGDTVSVPVGTGILLLTGFGVAYAVFRKKEEE